jgi:putative ABC transport system permease protein
MIRAALRNLLSHKLRLVLTVLAIVLGVSFVAGTFVFTDSLKKSFDSLFSQQSADAVVEPVSANGQGQGGGGGVDVVQSLPEATVAQVRAVPGVAEAEGFVSSRAAVVLGQDGKPLQGQNPNANGRSWLQDPGLGQISIAQGAPPTRDDQVALDATTASKAGVGIGDPVSIAPPNTVAGKGVVTLTVSGLVDKALAATAGGGTLAVFTLPEAQRLLLEPGKVSQVRVRAAPGVSQEVLQQRIETALPHGVQVRTGKQLADETSKRLEDSLGFLNTFLLVFALIALFVATFLIYNTFSMLVAQRSRELALLRAIGASRAQVQGTVLVEAAVVGFIASTLGLLAGLGLAQLLRGLFRAFGAELPAGNLVVSPRTVVATYAVGMLVTLVCAWIPARRAGRVPPVAAMRDDVSIPVRSLRVRAIVAGVLIAVAVLLAAAGLRVQDDATSATQLVGLSALAALVGAIAVAPFAARPLVGLLGAPFRGAVGRLATENGRRNPRRTAATATALTIGVALMSVLGVIAASATASIDRVIDDTIGADYVVFGVGFRPFSPDVFKAVDGTPGIGVATYVRQSVDRSGDSPVPVTGVQPGPLAQVVHLTFTAGSLADLGLGSAVVDTQTAKDRGLRVGQDVSLVLPNGKTTVKLAGLYEPAAFYRGYIVSLPTLASLGSLERDTALYLRLAPGADPVAVRADLDRRLAGFPTVTLQDQTQFKDEIRSQVNQLLGFLFALLALAVIIAVLGIVNTLLLSVVERTREIGLLRAVGATRPQVRRMITLEAVLMGVFGAVIGVVVGVLYGVLLQRVLEPQGITELDVPGWELLAFVLLGAVGGVLAAVWPAWRASRLDMLRAIASE